MKKVIVAAVALLAFAAAAYARVDINSATVTELEALKDIGPIKAKAIVEYRKKHGVFKSVDGLAKVPGIGKQTLEKIQGELTVQEATKPAVVDKKPAVSTTTSSAIKPPATATNK